MTTSPTHTEVPETIRVSRTPPCSSMPHYGRAYRVVWEAECETCGECAVAETTVLYERGSRRSWDDPGELPHIMGAYLDGEVTPCLCGALGVEALDARLGEARTDDNLQLEIGAGLR